MKNAKAEIFPELVAPEVRRRTPPLSFLRLPMPARVGPDRLVILTAFASGMLAVLILL